ncbi:hypothetical protein AVEN_179017-1 [Araneus ventricosus]|uniref:Uncharacterized protein n=1 Tax=Araneus ventricosus TaxID=182803 RepID=A0A4Y2RT40_ARAVE|nr:hypothetical protein AVEN_179017-1 [Araneus ventricosus]
MGTFGKIRFHCTAGRRFKNAKEIKARRLTIEPGAEKGRPIVRTGNRGIKQRDSDTLSVSVALDGGLTDELRRHSWAPDKCIDVHFIPDDNFEESECGTTWIGKVYFLLSRMPRGNTEMGEIRPRD